MGFTEKEKKAESWTVEDVYNWTKGKGHDEVAELLKKEGVDGPGFLEIQTEDLESIKKIGVKKRFEADFFEFLANKQDWETLAEAGQPSPMYLNFSCYDGGLVSMCCRAPFTERRTLPRVQIIRYSSGVKNRYGEDTEPAPRGTISFVMDLEKVKITNLSDGGSGGETRMSLSVGLSAEVVRTVCPDVNDYKDLGQQYIANWLKVSPEDDLEEARQLGLGCTVTYNYETKECVTEEWKGKEVLKQFPPLPASPNKQLQCEDVAKEGKCTFSVTGKKFVYQKWMRCTTCFEPEKNAGVCMGCAKTCHEGHEISIGGNLDRFYCDCGDGQCPQPCKALENEGEEKEETFKASRDQNNVLERMLGLEPKDDAVPMLQGENFGNPEDDKKAADAIAAKVSH